MQMRLPSGSTATRYGWGVVDAVVWFTAVVAATWMRHEYDVDATFALNTLVAASGTAVVHVALGLAVVSIIVQLKSIGEYVLEPPASRI